MNKRLLYAVAVFGVAFPSAAFARHDKSTPTPTPAAAPAVTPAAAMAPAAPEKVATVEGITEYRMPNGLRVLLFPDPSKQTTTVNVTYLVGSRHENYGETGMAHLLEHMLFKGSTKHTNIPQELTAHGARPNGSTSYDRTNYFETFQATDENLDWALDLESDRMVNSFVKKSDLDSEMTVVRNEFEMGENSPENVLEERIMSTAYLWHHYGNSTIGARADIEGVPIERLQAFYRTWYQPDNAVLVVAGKFDEAHALAKIGSDFGAIPKPARPLPNLYTAEPVQDGERTVTLRRVGDTQLVAAAYHMPAASHADAMACDVLAYILGDTPSGRLHKALVETGKAASVSGDAYDLHDPGVLFFSAEVRKEGNLDDVSKIFLKTIEGAASQPVAKADVERAKASWLKQFDLAMNDPNRVGLWISEWAASGDWRLLFLSRDRMKAVTPEDVQRVAKAYLKTSNRTVGTFLPTTAPDRSEVPPTPDIAALVKDYKGGQAIAAGETFDPSPSNIESRVTRGTLPMGLKTSFLPKKNRGETVFVQLNLRYGNPDALKGKATAAGLAGSMLMRGTTKHTRQQLQDEIDRMQARISVDGNAQIAWATIETKRDHLEEALRLAAEILRQPTFPASEFDQLKQEELASVEQAKSDPQFLAQNEFQRHTYPWPKDDPRYTMTADESVDALKKATLDQAKSFYKDFYGSSNGELSVVGDFDPKQVEALATELFSGWKSPKPYTRLSATGVTAEAIDKKIEAPDKSNATLFMGERFDMRDDDADYPAMVLGSFMTGGGFLNSRLAVRIRQKEGLSYGVGSGFSASALDHDSIFRGYAIYAPQNGAKVEQAFREEIARVLKDGFNDQELAEAKKGWLQGRQVGRAQDRDLASTSANYLFLQRTFAWDADLEKKVQALTGEQVRAAMAKHLDPSKMSYVQSGDFAGAAKKSTDAGSKAND